MNVTLSPEGTVTIDGLTQQAAEMMVEAICMYFAKGNRLTPQEIELVDLKVKLEKAY